MPIPRPDKTSHILRDLGWSAVAPGGPRIAEWMSLLLDGAASHDLGCASVGSGLCSSFPNDSAEII